MAVLCTAKMKFPEKSPMRMTMNLVLEIVSRRGTDLSICLEVAPFEGRVGLWSEGEGRLRPRDWDMLWRYRRGDEPSFDRVLEEEVESRGVVSIDRGVMRLGETMIADMVGRGMVGDSLQSALFGSELAVEGRSKGSL